MTHITLPSEDVIAACNLTIAAIETFRKKEIETLDAKLEKRNQEIANRGRLARFFRGTGPENKYKLGAQS